MGVRNRAARTSLDRRGPGRLADSGTHAGHEIIPNYA